MFFCVRRSQPPRARIQIQFNSPQHLSTAQGVRYVRLYDFYGMQIREFPKGIFQLGDSHYAMRTLSNVTHGSERIFEIGAFGF